MKGPVEILEEGVNRLSVDQTTNTEDGTDFSEYAWMADELEEFDMKVRTDKVIQLVRGENDQGPEAFIYLFRAIVRVPTQIVFSNSVFFLSNCKFSLCQFTQFVSMIYTQLTWQTYPASAATIAISFTFRIRTNPNSLCFP